VALLNPPDLIPASLAVLTVSDSRTRASDRSGDLIAGRLTDAGHELGLREILPDELITIRNRVMDLVRQGDFDFIITTGGTGFAPRDVTPEAVQTLFTKPLPGFGEVFRMLSYEEIGVSTIQSRATAGLIDNVVAFCLPGSTGACRLAMDEIILPQIDNRHKPCNFREIVPGPNSPLHRGHKPHQS